MAWMSFLYDLSSNFYLKFIILSTRLSTLDRAVLSRESKNAVRMLAVDL